ncbi:MAG: BON domain-containing protein, partial [Flavobacteriaceae bacterium]
MRSDDAMCRPWKWLWGLPLLIVLAALALWTRAGDIERDLAARARAALNEAGQPWAAVSVSGRELTISGTAADAGAQEGARLAAMVAGARTVTDSTALPPVRSPFGWTIRREDGKVELSGDVPPGDARRRIAAAAAQAFPRAEIADKTQTARGAPERGWFDAVSVALNMATLMSQGRVAISDRSLAAAGVAADPLAYESLHAAGGRMPAGYAVDVSGIEPPVVARQQLALSADAGRVTLTGTVPSRGARDELADAAGAAFPGRGVSAELGIARGVVAPEQWLAAARHAIDLLALAGAGEAELLNGSFSFRAQAPDAEAFDRLGAMLSDPPARLSFASV